MFEEIGVAEGSREVDERVTEVLKVIRQLEEYRLELKRLRRLLKDTGTPDISRSTRSLNHSKGNIACYIS